MWPAEVGVKLFEGGWFFCGFGGGWCWRGRSATRSEIYIQPVAFFQYLAAGGICCRKRGQFGNTFFQWRMRLAIQHTGGLLIRGVVGRLRQHGKEVAQSRGIVARLGGKLRASLVGIALFIGSIILREGGGDGLSGILVNQSSRTACNAAHLRGAHISPGLDLKSARLISANNLFQVPT